MSKADDIFWREFGIVLMALVLFTVIVFFTARTIGANTFEMMRNSPQAVLDRISPVGKVRVGDPNQVVAAGSTAGMATTTTASAPQPAEPQAGAAGSASAAGGEATYAKACIACHSTGVAGAPKMGDKAAWEPRLAQGIDTLYNSSLKGKGAMPPKGGNVSLSDDDVKGAVRYMLEKSGLEPG